MGGMGVELEKTDFEPGACVGGGEPIAEDKAAEFYEIAEHSADSCKPQHGPKPEHGIVTA